METEKLIAALRYCDAVVNDTVNTGSCNFCLYRDHCSDLDNEAADALERLTAQNVAKAAEIERLTNLVQDAQKQWKSEYAMRRKFEADRDRLQAELDAAVDDLKIASDCATCDMRGEKGFSACAPLFVGDEQSCKNYKWRGKENGDGKENS
ncbi:hypothetical protein [Oscillibacter ruminantium]|nr:hypothetical protein [Oscillibacter valericigenes]